MSILGTGSLNINKKLVCEAWHTKKCNFFLKKVETVFVISTTPSTIYNRIVNSMLCWLNADAAVLPAISGCSWRTMIVTRFLLGTR